MRQVSIAGSIAVALYLTSGAAALAGSFNPDPAGQYEVMKGVANATNAQEDALFKRIMTGNTLCTPQLYVDIGSEGDLEVTLLSSCHTEQQVTVTFNGKPTSTQMSHNGTAFVTLEQLNRASEVRAVFADGTQVQTAAPRRATRTSEASNS